MCLFKLNFASSLVLVRVLVNFKILLQRWNSDRTLESSRRYFESYLKDICKTIWKILNCEFNLEFGIGKHFVCLKVNCLLVYQPELSLISVSYICRHLFTCLICAVILYVAASSLDGPSLELSTWSKCCKLGMA